MMSKLVATIKAIVTRLVFGAHSVLAIWQVTTFKQNAVFWYLTTPVLILFFEGLFTLTIKDSQEWKWFCPSVFLYLCGVVPAIWLLELDKLDRRLQTRTEALNLTAINLEDLKGLDGIFGVQLKLPSLKLDAEMWVTLIEQFLMLVLILGRWMLPKGDLTRDQLSQLLLVYIGTAADIIEFFDSFKDDKIAREPVLVFLTLAIWTWSLLQFTVVLTATKSRKSRLTATTITTRRSKKRRKNKTCFTYCSIDVWGIVINIMLQDAPFFTFRLLLIVHYKIISYMNVFFTCKNTLVILLQLYRLYVVYSEINKQQKGPKKRTRRRPSVSIVSTASLEDSSLERTKPFTKKRSASLTREDELDDEEDDDDDLELSLAELRATRKNCRRTRRSGNKRQDTGYSTASSSRESPRPHYRDIATNTGMDTVVGKKRHSSKATMTSRFEVVNERPQKSARERSFEEERNYAAKKQVRHSSSEEWCKSIEEERV